MTTTMTITSLNQGKIAPRMDGDEAYWQAFQEQPRHERGHRLGWVAALVAALGTRTHPVRQVE